MKKKNNVIKNCLLGTIAFSILAGTGAILYSYIGDNKPNAFFVRSINDASYDCEDKINNKYDDDLISKYYDNLSSRYENNKNQYLIYYRISIKEYDNDQLVIKDYMAKCTVWEKLGYVSDFRVYKY